jgi:hypothetical protein
MKTDLGATPAIVHHMLNGNRRMGHLFTIPLCFTHHAAGVDNAIATSRHPHRKRFEDRYGSEASLHAWCRAQVLAANRAGA